MITVYSMRRMGLLVVLGLFFFSALPESHASYRIWRIGNETALSHQSRGITNFGDGVVYGLGGKLFRTNGTSSGTYHLATLEGPMAVFNSYVYYANSTHSLGRSNGMPDNDQLFFDTDGSPTPVGVLREHLVFFVQEKVYRTDGTLLGTELLYDFSTQYSFPSSSDHPRDFIMLGDYVYFVVGPGTGNHGVWRTDGTAEGTILLRERSDARLSTLTAGDSILFFSEREDTGVRLWTTDGSTAGTQMLRAFPFSSQWGSSFIISRSFANGTLWFGINPLNELWRSDGTTAGTELVYTFPTLPFGYGRQMEEMRAVGDIVFLRAAAEEDLPAHHLWRSDGTAAGTYRLVSSETGSFFALGAASLVGALDNQLLFWGNDDNGLALWLSDGADENAEKFSDSFSVYGESFAYKDSYLVSGNDGDGWDLWAITREESLQFIRQPSPSRWYFEGDLLDVSVEISLWAQDIAEYQWYKDDVPIEGAESSNLLVPMLTLDDSGHYFCRVNLEEKEGPYDSETVEIRVYEEGSMPVTTLPSLIIFAVLLSLCFSLRNRAYEK